MNCKHAFTHTHRDDQGHKWVVIYCTKCGVVSFDQAKHGTDGDYQKMLTKPIIL